MQPFVHLHNHTHYSFLDGACKIEDIVLKAKELKFPALAITDHGNMCGVIEFYQTCIKHGIKPIIGFEAYVASGSRHTKEKVKGRKEPDYHLTLLAKNLTGYKNLIYLSSRGYIEGFYYHPRIDKQILAEHSEGIIVLSGCKTGEIPSYILENKFEKALETAKWFKEVFGEDFYLEIQYHGLADEQAIIQGIAEIANKLDIPVVATNDVHYINKEDWEAHDVLLAIQTKKQIDDKDRLRFEGKEYYLKSYDEMYVLFGNDFPEALKNTVEIAEKCNLELKFDEKHLPEFKIPSEFKSDNEYLEYLAREGLKKRFGEKVTEEIKERLKFELDTIKKMKLSSYFLIVQDFVNFARKNGILVGPGRGSAAGSLLTYVLGITNINPLKYGLFFERFLNPERVSMPDIDIDFEDTRRDEVIEYAREKYGKDRVSQIITFGTFGARAVIKAVARVMGISFQKSNELTKIIPPDANLKEYLEENPELKKIINSSPEYKKMWEIACKLEGIISNSGKHAAGVVISDKNLEEYLPLYKASKDDVEITQFDMDTLKEIGLLKVDFLGLRTLTVVKECINMIKENEGIEIDIDNIPLDDEKTYKLLHEGKTFGVFQVESEGMTDLMKRAKPEKFEDIAVLIALYRPGPIRSRMVDSYVLRKNGEEKITYPDPSLKEILEETYGVIVYQEQVMKITQIIAGFSLGKADIVRRAMGEKDPEKMAAVKDEFIEGAKKRGFSEDKAEEIFNNLAQFAEYGFNKSHSVAYAMLTYITAYLKANYPEYFWAALLTSEINKIEKLGKYVSVCKKNKIKIKKPDINESHFSFQVKKENGEKYITYGLGGIKNVGKKIESVIKEREKNGKFKDIMDFFTRVNPKTLGRKTIESLAKAGAFDCFNIPRKQIVINYDKICSKVESKLKKAQIGQMGLFDLQEKSNESEIKTIFNLDDEWERNELLKYEKEVLEVYMSAHPLEAYERTIKKYTNINLENLNKYPVGFSCSLGGIITSKKVIRTKEKKNMAFVKLENFEGEIELVIMPDLYEKVKNLIDVDRVVIAKGILQYNNNDEYSIKVSELVDINDTDKLKISKVSIILRDTKFLETSVLEKLRTLLLQYPGDIDVFLFFRTPVSGKKYAMRLPATMKIRPEPKLFENIKSLLGEDSIVTQ